MMELRTPSKVIDRVVKVLGEIDVDPCADASRSVPATQHYTEEDDGLIQSWTGRVYLCPPYGREIGSWILKLHDGFARGQVTEAIALVPARTDTRWCRLFRDCPVCFVAGRLRFTGQDNSAPFPSAVFYLGKRPEVFFAAFSDIGDVWRRFTL